MKELLVAVRVDVLLGLTGIQERGENNFIFHRPSPSLHPKASVLRFLHNSCAHE